MTLSEIKCEVKQIKKQGFFYMRGHTRTCRGEYMLYAKKCHICVWNHELVAWKHFGRHKQWWHYEIDCRYGFWLSLRDGRFVSNPNKLENIDGHN